LRLLLTPLIRLGTNQGLAYAVTMNEVSSTRLYLGNLPRNATKADVEAHFQTHGTGEITEVKLMNGFGFIEYKDALDARDVVPGEPLRHIALLTLTG
jgi:hypothetical protein